MKFGHKLALVGALLVATAANASAQSNIATQDVGWELEPSATIQLSSTSTSLKLSSIASGQASVSSTGLTYSISSTYGAADARAVTAVLNQNLPGNITLSVNFTPPTGGSGGVQTLSTTPVTVLTNVGPVSEEGIAMEYTLTASSGAVTGSGSVTVTYTVTAAL